MEVKHIFKRKLYNRLLEWKTAEKGRTALLIEGARRVGKSTLAEEFAKNEYASYILIDFSKVSKKVLELFEDISDLDHIFMQLQFEFNVVLHERESVIIFDEVQFQPLARQAIKHLVADRRYDYMETGSLISISKNVKNILIPSEEERVRMNPMDYEEFLWATGNEAMPDLLRMAIKSGRPLDVAHRKLMRDFRLYMLVGGMPQAVAEYLDTHNMMRVDKVKRGIITLYESDFKKIDSSGRIGRLFQNVPAQLNRKASRFMPTSAIGELPTSKEESLISELADSMTVNLCHHTADPSNGLAMDFDKNYYKIYTADTGLFITLAFWDKDFTENTIYSKLLSDKLEANLGYVYENVVAQILVACGRNLFYYTFPNDNRNLHEIDFLISVGHKIDPIEVKSSGYLAHKSLDLFCSKYSSVVKTPWLVYTKDIAHDGMVRCLPVYLLPFIDEIL